MILSYVLLRKLIVGVAASAGFAWNLDQFSDMAIAHIRLLLMWGVQSEAFKYFLDIDMDQLRVATVRIPKLDYDLNQFDQSDFRNLKVDLPTMNFLQQNCTYSPNKRLAGDTMAVANILNVVSLNEAFVHLFHNRWVRLNRECDARSYCYHLNNNWAIQRDRLVVGAPDDLLLQCLESGNRQHNLVTEYYSTYAEVALPVILTAVNLLLYNRLIFRNN